mgnify:CR=1 FL=1
MTLYTHQAANIRKTWLLMATFFGIVIAIGWVFSQVYGSSGILYIAVIISVLMNVISYWFSDKIVLRLHRARPVDLMSVFLGFGVPSPSGEGFSPPFR